MTTSLPEASEFDTLDELKEDLKKVAAQDAEGRQATAARDAFIAKLEDGLEIPVPKGVKAEMVEQQLKNVTADPSKGHQRSRRPKPKKPWRRNCATRWCSTCSPRPWTSRSPRVRSSTSSPPSPSSTAWTRTPSSRPSSATARSVPPCRKSAAQWGLLSGMRAVTFKSEGETLDLSVFLGEAAEDEESESVEAASAAAAVADELAADKDAE